MGSGSRRSGLELLGRGGQPAATGEQLLQELLAAGELPDPERELVDALLELGKILDPLAAQESVFEVVQTPAGSAPGCAEEDGGRDGSAERAEDNELFHGNPWSD